MMYYRCKCGHSEAFGSMPPARCSGCEKCNTTLELHPDHHRTPEPHVFVVEYERETGMPYRVCDNCHKQVDIDAVDAAEGLLLLADRQFKEAGLDQKFDSTRKAIADALASLNKTRFTAEAVPPEGSK